MNGFGFYRIFRRPHDQSVRRYLLPTVIVPILFLVVNLVRLNHHGGWDIAVTCIVTILPVALCAAVMLRLRAEVVREYVIAARSGRRPPSLTTPELDSRVAPPMPTLNVTTGPAEGRSVDVGDGIVIGRGDADLSIDDDELSRQHVRVRPIDGGVVVEDLGSTNGSWLNGERINGAVVVTRSGILRVGRSEISIAVEPADSTVVGETPDELRLSDATVIREIPQDLVDAGSPDDTRIRARPSMPPPLPLERVSNVPAAPLPESSPPQPPPQPPPTSARRSRGGAPLIIGGLVVAAAVAVLIAAQTGNGAKTRRLSANVDLTTIAHERDRTVLAGTHTGRPVGDGAATADQVFLPGGAPTNPGPIPISEKLVIHTDDGTITSVIQMTAARQSDQSVKFEGEGNVTGGTGKFDGASGSFRYEASQPPLTGDVNGTIDGTLKY